MLDCILSLYLIMDFDIYFCLCQKLYLFQYMMCMFYELVFTRVIAFVTSLLPCDLNKRMGCSNKHFVIKNLIISQHIIKPLVQSFEQKSIGLKFFKSRTGSDVRYSCHHNSSRFTFPIFADAWRFSVFHSLQSITPRIY